MATADPKVAQLLERQASEALRRLARPPLLRERVREFVRQNLTETPTANKTAKRLGMSLRTLHRRLVEEGTAYRVVVNDVRLEMALHCLRDPHLSVREVGSLLGFTTLPAFHRAFRRWTGTTPTEHRLSLQEPTPSRSAASTRHPPRSLGSDNKRKA